LSRSMICLPATVPEGGRAVRAGSIGRDIRPPREVSAQGGKEIFCVTGGVPKKGSTLPFILPMIFLRFPSIAVKPRLEAPLGLMWRNMEERNYPKAPPSGIFLNPSKAYETIPFFGHPAGKPEEVLHLCLSSIGMAKIPILWVNADGRFILVNEEACRFSGYSREELLSLTVGDILPEQKSIDLREWIPDITARGALSFESAVQTKEGGAVSCEITATFLSLNGSEYFFTFVREVTEHRRTEWTLKNSEKHYRTIFETTGAATLILEEDESISMVNHEFERITGKKKEEIVGRKWTEFIGGPDRERMARYHRLRRLDPDSAPSRYEASFVNREGEKRDILVFVGLIPETGRSIVSFLDITDRKRAEEAAKTLAREKETLAEISRIIGSTLEIEEVYEKFAEEVRKLIPFDRLAIEVLLPDRGSTLVAHVTGVSIAGRAKGSRIPLGGSLNEAVLRSGAGVLLQGPEKELAARYPSLRTTLEAGLRSFLSIPLISRGDAIGLLHFRSLASGAYRESDRRMGEAIGTQIAGAIANAELFAKTKETEEALRRSEEKYRILVQNANDAIFIAQDGQVKFPSFQASNPKFLEVTGYSAEELATAPPANSIADFIHPEDRKMVLDRHAKRMRGEDVPKVYSFRLLNKKGETVWVQLNSAATEWEGRPAVLCFLRDISQEKKLETQVFTAQKMEAVGTLAAGIAHDFNNILMGIRGYASLALLGCGGPAPEGQAENLKRIEDLVKSGSALTGQLLAFARKGKYEVKPSDLNRILERTVDLFGRTKKEVRHHKRLAGDLWPVEVDCGQMDQVFLNLFVNAWQAMPAGGNLYLETRNVTLGQDYLKPFFVKPGNYVKVAVTDTGAGMDKQTLRRIFEPFFTTRELGRGTGLGLATVYGIIKNHGGHINVYSEPGLGTTFTLYLPASPGQIREEQKAPVRILQGRETILLVDDEETITDVVAKALRMTGYNPLVARSGGEAVEKYRALGSQIDLILLDMIMPGIGGGAAFDRFKEINPAVKVILSSGYSLDGEASRIMEKGCRAFIQKPFGIQELSQKIREVLDA
jgi:two-component system, cell cycle sensor histidine kinase and response regulator CckA